MIVVDSSALVAILWSEPEAGPLQDRLAQEAGAILSAATRLEAFALCVQRKGLEEGLAMERLIAGLGLITVPFDELQLTAARDAYAAHGGGRHGLGYGDCFSYALAKTRGLPLLFTGDRFRATDVEPAL